MDQCKTKYSLIVVSLTAMALLLVLLGACQGEIEEDQALLSNVQADLKSSTGLVGEIVSGESFAKGIAPEDYQARTGVNYRPSFNEHPGIPEQCWIETGYGTQNACKYCHTDYLSKLGHGNNIPIGEDQILYSFPTPALNKIAWRNITHPQEITTRLSQEGISIPHSHDQALLDYVRQDNWTGTYMKARSSGDESWNNLAESGNSFQLFPALDPRNLFPFRKNDPTGGGTHGYIDPEGFVRNSEDNYTGWRAINFFPYSIFTPLTGSVSGIYIRLPEPFMQTAREFDLVTYKHNLDLLEANIKNQPLVATLYAGDAGSVPINKGFFPLGTEFAHPLHYVDLNADGDSGMRPNGVSGNNGVAYEFPGTRSKRVKEIRYMYKWKAVTLEELAEPGVEGEDGYQRFLSNSRQGWIDNGAGWILAAYIEDRKGNLRPQTTEELVQCKGCHALTGNTVDSVWSFQRKLPEDSGWRDMNYGEYNARTPEVTRLPDFENLSAGMGVLGYFFYTVVGADLFGVTPSELKEELLAYASKQNLVESLKLEHPLQEIFDDEALKNMERDSRQRLLLQRQNIMRHYAREKAYLDHDEKSDAYFIRGSVFYPSEQTMQENIQGYYKIVLDQSFNLSKHVFGEQPEGIPFTFRSDGTVLDADRKIIPVGEVINGRPWGEDGVGTTPTGIVEVNDEGLPVNAEGVPVDLGEHPEQAAGHVSTGGTFDMMYNSILSDIPVRRD